MKRGDIWTLAGGPDYLGKPRPAVILQDESFADTASVTVCCFTSRQEDAPLFRLLILPDNGNGLHAPSRLMIDKIATVPKAKIGTRIGRLSDVDILRLNQSTLVFLGLAGSPKQGR